MLMAESLRFELPDGLVLTADAYGPADAPAVLMAHGGGQTRHAWGSTARELAANGWRAVSIDQRGHGDSGWAADGDYKIETFARDLMTVADAFPEPPALVGASLGGLCGIIGQGELVPAGRRGYSALVLVDVTPRIEQEGVDRIRGFMREHLEEGFATLQEAADAIAAYLPHRPAPKNLEGLRKNLRQGDDGRYRWHWDPRFVSEKDASFNDQYGARLLRATERIDVPTLLVRGGRSEVVSDEVAREFLAHLPHARYLHIGGAGHMVAGDENDAFADAVIDFLAENRSARAG